MFKFVKKFIEKRKVNNFADAIRENFADALMKKIYNH